MTAPPPLVSLIVATVDRVELVGELLASLVTQTLQDFEVVVVDQNRDDRLVALLAHYDTRLAITHIRAPRGLSRSRNAGSPSRAARWSLPRRRLPLQAGYACARRRLLACTTGRRRRHRTRGGGTRRARAGAVRARRALAVAAQRFVGGMSCVIFMRMQLCARSARSTSAWDSVRRRRGRPPRKPLPRACGRLRRAHPLPAGTRRRHPGPRGALTSAFVAQAPRTAGRSVMCCGATAPVAGMSTRWCCALLPARRWPRCADAST